MTRRALRYLLPLVVFLLALGLPPLQARADSPAEQLASLAKHVDAAIARLEAGDLVAARAELKAFKDGWSDIEDGIRNQSRASYRAIEDAMGDAGYALQAEPFDAAKAQVALKQLRSECDAFISGQFRETQAPSDNLAKPVTLAAVAAHLGQAQAKLDAGESAAAAREVAAFRRGWPEVEGLVKAKSARTYADTENNMARAYALLTQQPPDLIGARETLVRMKTALAPFAENQASYGIFDATIILVREGLEALLVVGALLAFLKKTNNGDKGRWIWAGTGAGVLASVVVAVIISIVFSRAAAGANRELLEGLTGLFAAAMLIYVSYWLHSKASLSTWQSYIHDKSTAALARNSLLSLSLISFLAVFREGAETILFYVGIAPSITLSDLVLGLALGTGLLAVIGALLLVFGVRIPIRTFFLGTSVLIYYLAFKFIGTGIHALQVAGVVGASPADFLPENGFLGLFPTWETTIVQAALMLAAIVVVLAGLVRGSARGEHASATG